MKLYLYFSKHNRDQKLTVTMSYRLERGVKPFRLKDTGNILK